MAAWSVPFGSVPASTIARRHTGALFREPGQVCQARWHSAAVARVGSVDPFGGFDRKLGWQLESTGHLWPREDNDLFPRIEDRQS